MSDSRLNSIHLDNTRREDFRRAREKLLNSRGSETLRVESKEEFNLSLDNTGIAVQQDNPLPANVKYFLKDKDTVYPLKVGLNTIGRLPDNDVVIEDPHVSRRHCAIVVHLRSDCEIHDVASKNGTCVNGSRLAGSIQLHSGDEIRMCDHPVIFMTQSDSLSKMAPALLPTQ